VSDRPSRKSIETNGDTGIPTIVLWLHPKRSSAFVFAMTRRPAPSTTSIASGAAPRTSKSTDWLVSSFQPTTESTC